MAGRTLVRGCMQLMPGLWLSAVAAHVLWAGDVPVGWDPATDWPAWRGPTGDGMAARSQNPPIVWDQEKNVRWNSRVPGRGHGSPIVVGDQVVLTVADSDTGCQSLQCFDRIRGELAWDCRVHQGGIYQGGNQKASQASTTPACDGERFYVNFLNADAVWTTAVSRGGEVLWQQKVTDYVVHQGFGSSPRIYGDLIIVSADNKGGGAVVALDRGTGALVWKHDRPRFPNYASPIVLHVAGRDQLLLTGCDLVTSLNPLTGDVHWEIAGATTECVTSTVTDGTRIFTSGGYPKNHISAVRADGSGVVEWENTVRTYVPSMLQRDGYLYTLQDAGLISCFRSSDGEEMWKHRLGGTFSSSPVMVGHRLYAGNEEGEHFVLDVEPEGFELLASNRLGNSNFSTPAICGGQIFMRVAFQDGDVRTERLYCLADK